MQGISTELPGNKNCLKACLSQIYNLHQFISRLIPPTLGTAERVTQHTTSQY